jgi:hypothetical protein
MKEYMYIHITQGRAQAASDIACKIMVIARAVIRKV